MIELKNQENKKLVEYQLALDDPNKKKDIDFGNNLFPNSQKRELETLRGIEIEKKNVQATLVTLKEKYKHIFTANEIKEECLEYNLRFIQAGRYEGDFDYEYIKKIREFYEQNNLGTSANDLKYNFYILTSTFNTENPLIFYKHDERGVNYFVMIDGDKNYVNLLNWVLGIKYSNEVPNAIINMMVAMVIFNLITCVFCLLGGVNFPIGGHLLTVLLTFVASWIVIPASGLKNHEENERILADQNHILNQRPRS